MQCATNAWRSRAERILGTVFSKHSAQDTFEGVAEACGGLRWPPESSGELWRALESSIDLRRAPESFRGL
eukprot:10236721-Alexandrium_andersonii.AAC.1